MNEITKKNKLLFWLDGPLYHFCIAKYIKDNLDCEVSAIVHSNELIKDFSLTQKFIDFKQLWFPRDTVNSSGEPDMEYLLNIEKKFGIPLWLIAYTERIFYGYTRYKKFSQKEILNIFENSCKYYEQILDIAKPDFVIMRSNDYHHISLFYHMCKAKNIKILLLTSSRLGYRSFIADEIDPVIDFKNYDSKKKYSQLDINEYNSNYSKSVKSLVKKYKSSKILMMKSFFIFMFLLNNKTYRKYYANEGKTRLNIFYNEIKYRILSKYRKNFIDGNLIKSFDKNIPYVYFPLHFEPERTLLVSAPYYTEQFSVILNIAKSIPINYTLYVKEHPSMKLSQWRPTSFYKKLLELPNVKLLHPDISSDELIKNSKLVVTISGTSGLEAVFNGISSIVFSDTIYSKLPSVFRATGFENLSNLITTALNNKPNFTEIKNFIDSIEKISIVLDDRSLIVEAYEKFAAGGFLSDVEISEDKMDEYLKKHKVVFTDIAKKYIEKINELDSL